MSLAGSYLSKELGATMIIETADDSTGQASGSISIDGVTIPVNIHYHWEGNVGPVTDLWLAGNTDNPNRYIGAAGRTTTPDYATIQLAGGYPTESAVRAFEGSFERV